MLKKSFLLGCVCALGLAASPALAGDFSGTISGNYLNVNLNVFGASVSGDGWGGIGELQGALGDTGIHAQADGSYNKVSISGADFDVSAFHGSLFMPFDKGRAGATVGYDKFHASAGGLSGSAHMTNYGAFAEFWAGSMFTIGAKVGGLSGSGSSGYYLGGEAVVYPMPDLAISGNIDHTGNNGETDYTASAEYLVSEDVPVSVGGGYTYVDLPSGIGHASIWTVNVKLYFGDDSDKTLVDHQRNGNLGWAATTARFGVTF